MEENYFSIFGISTAARSNQLCYKSWHVVPTCHMRGNKGEKARRLERLSDNTLSCILQANGNDNNKCTDDKSSLSDPQLFWQLAQRSILFTKR